MEQSLKRQHACDLLGLPKEANIEQAEKRYQILARKARSRQLRGEWHEEDQRDWEEVQAAYRFFRHEDEMSKLNHYRQQHYGKYKKFAGLAEKADHFWFYHRYKLLGMVFVLAVLASITFVPWHMATGVSAELPPPDLKVMVIGDFAIEDHEQAAVQAEQKLLAQIPDWDHIEMSLYDVPPNPTGRMETAKAQRGAIALTTERPDVYIVDHQQYLHLLQNGFLRKFASEEAHVVEIGGGPLQQTLMLSGGPVYAAVSIFAEETTNAFQFIERFGGNHTEM